MNRGLEIYKLSGIGNIEDFGKYKYWTDSTNEITNTLAFNYLLSVINRNIVLLQVDTGNRIALINEVDMAVVCLEALKYVNSLMPHTENTNFRLTQCGSIIQQMINAGEFDNKETDDQRRADNLDKLISDFFARLENDPQLITGEFTAWWQSYIIEQNFNDVPEYQQQAYNKIFVEKTQSVNGVNPEDYETMSDYIMACGSYFLYFFMGDEKIKNYRAIIQMRYRKEKEFFNEVCTACKGVYSREDVYNKLYAGVTHEYKMRPEKKIEQLEKLGKNYYKIGTEPITIILTAIATILSIILSLIALFKEVFAWKYQRTSDTDAAIAQKSDWNIDEAFNDDKEKKSTGAETSKFLKIALISTGLLLFLKN